MRLVMTGWSIGIGARRLAAPRGAALAERLVGAAVALVAAGIAATVAHLVIDLAGDVLLPRDSYDFVAHHSRAVAVVGALALTAAALLHVLDVALAEARGGDGISLRAVFDNAVPRRTPWRFVALTVVGAILGLMAMEAFDSLASHGTMDDIGDLFGGSLWLGLGIAIPIAGLTGGLVWRAARFVAESHRAIVHAVAVLFAIAGGQPPPGARPCGGVTPMPTPHRRAMILARHAGKRAPPRLRRVDLT
jgi:hypothetical protein